ncbi:response regulator [Candidatus Bathyarchaeota archaeon]|nr:response regulator [Candidatus Bathyarchaeota archaeon]
MRKAAIGRYSDSQAIKENSNLKIDLKFTDQESGLNILYVDDELGSFDFSKEILELKAKEILELKGNFRVDVAASVDEAFKKLETQSYDVIVSDYQMPGKNGLDFLREMCQSGYTTPFILFTGKIREEVAVKEFNLGAFRYVNKHGDPETVYGKLLYSIIEASEQAQAT